MRLTTSMTVEREVTRGRDVSSRPGLTHYVESDVAVEETVEVVGTVEDRGEEGLLVHVETVDEVTPSRWERELRRLAEEALGDEYERLRARGEAA